MNKFDTPLDFDTNIDLGDLKITYANVTEICQGGPVVGTILVNDICVQQLQFGGPILLFENRIYAPVLSRSFWGSIRFKLGSITFPELNVNVTGDAMPLIFLDRIEAGTIIYYKDLEKKRTDHVALF